MSLLALLHQVLLICCFYTTTLYKNNFAKMSGTQFWCLEDKVVLVLLSQHTMTYVGPCKTSITDYNLFFITFYTKNLCFVMTKFMLSHAHLYLVMFILEYSSLLYDITIFHVNLDGNVLFLIWKHYITITPFIQDGDFDWWWYKCSQTFQKVSLFTTL